MFKKRIQWYLIFQDERELETFFVSNNTRVHKGMFGEVLLVRSKQSYYAFKNKCPHQNKPLDGCSEKDGFVICPFHKYHYDLKDGRGHGLCLDKYHLKIDDSGVYVGKEKWSFF